MKRNVKPLLGGVVAVSILAGLAAAVFSLSRPPAEPDGAAEASTEPPAPELPPVPSPRDTTELASIHQPSLEAPARQAEPEPAPSVEPAPSHEEPFLDESGPVRVRRLIVATGIEDHEPTGAADELELGTQSRIYAFVDAANHTEEDVSLKVTFEPESGESTGHVSLDVPAGAPRWRTWAYTRNITRPGRWRAVVRAGDGHVLARRSFEVR